MQTAFLESVQEKKFTGSRNKVQGTGGGRERRLYFKRVFADNGREVGGERVRKR